MTTGAQVIQLRPVAPPVACDSAPVLQPRADRPSEFGLLWMQQLGTFIGETIANLRPENAATLAGCILHWMDSQPVLPAFQARMLEQGKALLRDAIATQAYGEIMSAVFHAHVLIGVDAASAHMPIWKTA